ncbi:hypothetical protein DXB00_05845 [Butyricicoccus sp. OF10-2]|nr:hypothetical protein DXB00_05845 [Butyricicoccus sp. OF10-2]
MVFPGKIKQNRDKRFYLLSLFCMNYVDEKDAPIQSPISSSRKPAERLRLEKEEQRNECALTFLIKKSEQAI